MAENKTIRLPIVFCLLVDFPDDKVDCSPSSITADHSTIPICFKCPKLGRFLTGDLLDDHGSAGHIICILIWILVVIVGLFGTITNCLIISIMRRHNGKRSFDFLLIVLASFDLLSCMMSVISTSAMVTYYEDLDRGPVTLFMYYMPFLLSLLGRTGSSYMTVLITVERFLVIRYPIKSGAWFTPTNTKLMTVGVAIFAVLLNIPRVSSLMLSRNDAGKDVPSLLHMEYIIRSTELEEFWYHSLKSVHYLIDIMVPFPLLIIFNTLLFIEIKRFTSKRKELSRKQMKDIRAARMFVPVVIVLFLCNIEPMSHYLTLHITGMYYRELVLFLNLSITVNASANLPIYYARGHSFRQEIQSALPSFLQCGNPKEESKTGDISMVGRHTPGNSSSNDQYF
ncbi:unnamed protein product [Orchesella dallaii]|uniref:G-protein coupled receptors family 1 profile domain-containing protein n=1 Tax=Orchesella dallaii TaxID=48710 RepID=A0ABP1QNK7_9HEXA